MIGFQENRLRNLEQRVEKNTKDFHCFAPIISNFPVINKANLGQSHQYNMFQMIIKGVAID